MKKTTLFIIAGLLGTNGLLMLSFASEKKESHKVERLPNSYEFLKDPKSRALPSFYEATVIWPTEAVIASNKADRSNQDVQYALKSTRDWINTILKPEYQFNESEVELLPLKSTVEGYDAVRLRYKTGNYVVQVLSTSSGMIIAIKDESKKVFDAPIDLAKAKIYAQNSMDRFLNKSARIKEISTKIIKKKEGAATGSPKIQRGSLGNWWGYMSWWTDGQTILFSTGKLKSSNPRRPSLREKWFSE